MAESGVVMIFFDDAYFLSILSSNLHIIWSLKAGGWMGEGNDPVYKCDSFPRKPCIRGD